MVFLLPQCSKFSATANSIIVKKRQYTSYTSRGYAMNFNHAHKKFIITCYSIRLIIQTILLK